MENTLTKKRVLVVLNTMGHGGVANSLLNFIANLKDYVELELFLFRDDGELMDKLPKDIKCMVSKGYMGVFTDNRKKCKKLGFKRYLFKCLMGIWVRIFRKNKNWVKFALKHSEKFEGYDVAISFNGVAPNGSPWVGSAEFVIYNVKAKQKFAITHDDYMSENYKAHSVTLYSKFDKIFAVSKSCMDNIIKNVPKLSDKFEYCYNFCQEKEILEKAKEKGCLLNETNIKIITVARLSNEKGIIRILPILKNLKELNFKFMYYIVGNGPQKEKIERFIFENGMTDVVKVLGYQNNPFKLISQSDLFLLPSIRESFGLVLVESMILGVPVLTTKTVSAEEIVGDYGFVCEMDDESIFEALKQILKHTELLNEKRKKLSNYKFSNEQIREKWLKMISGKEWKIKRL